MSTPAHQFPYECTDDELKATINKYAAPLQGPIQSAADVTRLAPLVQLGLNEQQNRATRRANEKAEQIAEQAVLISKVTLVVAVVSLLFTMMAAYYAWQATRSSDRWEARQVQQLDGLRRETVATRVSIEQLPAAMATARGNDARKPRR